MSDPTNTIPRDETHTQAIDAAVAVFDRALRLVAPPRHVIEEAFDAAGAVYAAADDDQVGQLLRETGFIGMEPLPDGALIRLKLAHDVAAGMVKAFDELVRHRGAPNYVETSSTVTNPDPDDPRKYTVIIVRPEGKTPHELRLAAEAERDQLAGLVNGLLEHLDAIADLGHQASSGGAALHTVTALADRALALAGPCPLTQATPAAAEPQRAHAGEPGRAEPDVEDVASALLQLGRFTLAFGRVDRKTFHPDGVRAETDTDHTVMLALAGCALARRFFPRLDVGLVAQYALVHDTPEVYADDTATLRMLTDEQLAAKTAREQAGRDRISAEFQADLPWLPETLDAYEHMNRWLPEARFVWALDKVMPKITHVLNGVVAARRQGISHGELADRYRRQFADLNERVGDFPLLLDVYTMLVDRELELLRQAEQPAQAGAGGKPSEAVSEIVHLIQDGRATTNCCYRTPFDLPDTERLTENPDDVTCGLVPRRDT